MHPGFRVFMWMAGVAGATLLQADALRAAEARVPVDAELDTQAVLRLVDPQYPGLREVAAAVEAGDMERAQGLLARHFAAREQPVVPPPALSGVGEGNSTAVIRAGHDRAAADATLMKHVFTLSNNDAGKQETYDLGAEIQWTRNPSKALSWILYLNQLNHLATLAGVYRDTGDERYVREIGAELIGWTQQCHRGYGYTRDGEIVASGMEVRNRLCNLVAAYDIVRKSPALTPRMHLAFWKMLIACSRELMQYDGVSYPGLIPAAVMYPEFTEAKAWLKAGEENLRVALVDRTSPEGAWDTHSISYQTVPVPWAARALEFLEANPGSGDFAAMAHMARTQCGKLLSLMLWMAMPNGGLPNIGDTYGRPDWNSGTLNPMLDSYLSRFGDFTPEQRARLKGIADPFDRLKATLAAAGLPGGAAAPGVAPGGGPAGAGAPVAAGTPVVAGAPGKAPAAANAPVAAGTPAPAPAAGTPGKAGAPGGATAGTAGKAPAPGSDPVATSGGASVPVVEPAVASVAFPGSGYYVMRSGWEAGAARYLSFDLSPQALGHAHEDAGHFDLYAYGKPLLVDTGDYFLGWGYRTALHNAVEVDGRTQARNDGAPMMPHEWVSTRAFDFVDGAHGAYEELGVTHRRKILFVKPDYYLLCDLLAGKGRHSYEQFLHFAGPTQTAPAQVRLDPTTGLAVSTHAGTANVHVVPAYPAGLQSAFAEAQDTDMRVDDKRERKAMLGWLVTGGTFQRVKSPVVVYTREGEGPQSFHDVLFPVPAGGEASVRVEPLPVREGGRPLPPEEAAGLAVHVRLERPAHAPESIRMNLGDNLAQGRPGFAEINQTSIGAAGTTLTDGDAARRVIGGGLASASYTPNVLLKGRFGVDLGGEVEVNTVVLHHGTWNGSAILYPAEKMSVQYWDGDQWKDVGNARTAWGEEQVSTTLFDTVRTNRLSVAVERPSGGRLALREFAVHFATEEEKQRVERLRRERSTEEWTDLLLVSHRGPGRRTYGDLLFDGEVAVVRKDAAGKITRIAVKTGKELSEKERVLFESDQPVDALGAEWRGDLLRVDCPAPHGARLPALSARRLEANGRPVKPVLREGVWALDRPAGKEPLRLADLRVNLEPAQKGMAGAQPSALVSWKTNVPATSRVEFGEGTLLDRRSPLDTDLVTEHQVRVYFLRPGKEYQFRAVSVDEWGRRAEAPAR